MWRSICGVRYLVDEQRDLDVVQPDLVERPAEKLRRGGILGRRHVAGRRKRALDLHVGRVGRPGEVVHVPLLVGEGRRAVRIRRARRPHAGGADDEAGRDRDVDQVVAEVGVELGIGVELVAVPAAGRPSAPAGRLVDAELREPLTHEVEVAVEAGAGEDLRQLRREGDVERERAARRHRFGQRESHDRLVVLVPVVGLLEAQGAFEVAPVGERHRGDVDPTPPAFGHPVAAQLASRLLHERALGVLERVQVEVEPEIADRVGGRVGPGEALPAVEPMGGRVERDVDSVVDHLGRAVGQPVGQRGRGEAEDEHCGNGSAHGASRNGRAHCNGDRGKA